MLGISAAATGYGFHSARRLRIFEVSVPIPDLPSELVGFTIAQISDLHVGQSIGRDFVEEVVGKVNELFKKNSGGRDLSDVPARAFTGFIALADAINRAGSTDPEKIRKALTETNIPGSQLIVPYRGIKFGADGQNELTRGILMQAQGGKYCTVYPFEFAACELKYPMPTWAEKAKM